MLKKAMHRLFSILAFFLLACGLPVESRPACEACPAEVSVALGSRLASAAQDTGWCDLLPLAGHGTASSLVRPGNWIVYLSFVPASMPAGHGRLARGRAPPA